MNVNQSEDACAAYDEGIALAGSTGDSVEHCTLLHNKGFALLRQGCPERAAESFAECINVARDAESEDRQMSDRDREQIACVRLQSCARMGAAYCRLGRVDSGLELLNEAYAEVSASKDSDWRHSAYLVALTQFGKCMCGFPLLDPSSSALKEALDVKRGLELLLEAREFVMQRPQGPGAMYKGSLKEDISLMIGLVYEFTGNFPAAIEYLKEADASSWQRWLHLHEDSVSRSFRDDPLAFIISVSLQRVLLRAGDAKEALRVAECSRARSFVALLGAERSGGSTGSLEIADLCNVAAANKAALLYFSVLADHEVCAWVVSSLGEFRGHVLTNVSPMFKEEDLILGKIAETVRGDLKTPETSIAQESDEDASEADFDARGWRLPIISRRQAQERLTCCYRALIEPVEHLLDGEQHLIIVPDHHLWMLPFAALQLPSGKYLIEKFSIRLAPSVQTLMQISKRREQISRMPAVTPTALVVGVSEFSGHTELQLQPLPSVPSECKAVCDACGRAEIVVQHVMENEASAQSFVDRCPSATHLIHVATHGLLEQSALVLHGTPASAILPASEIQALKISSRVVVLSACNTGRGSVGADGVFGLTRSFLVAGADLVMGTLWHTGDASSEVFMSGFYSCLLDSGLPEHVAVQQAMCAMIHETDDRGKLRWRPASWAPFFLVGSASPSPVLGSSRSMEDDNGYKCTVECKTMLANSSGAVPNSQLHFQGQPPNPTPLSPSPKPKPQNTRKSDAPPAACQADSLSQARAGPRGGTVQGSQSDARAMAFGV